jgi:carboxypeptidase family protein
MSRIRRAFILAGVAVLSAMTAQSVTAQSRGLGRISGTVSSESGEPIAGAAVKVEIGADALEGKSDGSGKWAVSGLGKGQFFMEISKDGFETKRVRLVIEKESMSSDPIKVALKKS